MPTHFTGHDVTALLAELFQKNHTAVPILDISSSNLLFAELLIRLGFVQLIPQNWNYKQKLLNFAHLDGVFLLLRNTLGSVWELHGI